MTQHLYFDPTGEGTGTQLDVMADPYALAALEAPAPSPEFAFAGSIDTEGDTPAARRHQNRRVKMSVEIVAANATARDAAIDDLTEKAAKIFRQGGTLRYVKDDGSYRTLDLLASEAYDPSFDVPWSLGQTATVSLEFVAKPYARGPAVNLGTFTETSAAALVFTVNTSSIGGDVDATITLTITEGSSHSQNGVLTAVQNEHYTAAASGGVLFEAEALTLGVGSLNAGPAGASGASTVLYGSLDSSADPIVSFNVGQATHVGTHRVFSRVYLPNTNAGDVSLSLYWYPMGSPTATFGPTVTVPGDATPFSLEQKWIWVDLGLVIGTNAAYGTSGWSGSIYASSTNSGDDIYIDQIMVVPVDEGYTEYKALTAAHVAAVPTPLPSGNDLVVTSAGSWTEYGGGIYFQPRLEGDLLTLPVGAATTRFIIKGFRDMPVGADFDRSAVYSSFTGDVNDDLSAVLTAVPRYLSFA